MDVEFVRFFSQSRFDEKPVFIEVEQYASWGVRFLIGDGETQRPIEAVYLSKERAIELFVELKKQIALLD